MIRFISIGEGKILLLLLLVTMLVNQAQAQRAFITKVNGTSRSYWVLCGDLQSANLPLVIVFHSKAIGSASIASDSVWKGIRRPAIVIFSSQLRDSGTCMDEKSLKDDLDFVHALVHESYDNFHIDRNQVYITNATEYNCLVEKFTERFPGVITATHSFPEQKTHATILETINTLLNIRPAGEPVYEVWKNPLFTDDDRKAQVEDSVKRVRWCKRIFVEFRPGIFEMNRSVKTDKDKTYMNISDAHTMFDLRVTYWKNESIGLFADLGWLKIPQKQEFNGARIEAGGGLVIPFSVGACYAFHYRKTRPYISLGTGLTSVVVFGGRFSPNIDPNQIKNRIKSETRFAFQTTIETGLDYRLGKRFLTGVQVKYMHSLKFEPAGMVNAIRGLNASVSIGYIVGANRLKAGCN